MIQQDRIPPNIIQQNVVEQNMIHQSIPDTNKYRFITLNNKIQALLVHNEKFTNSGCAVSVNVGSYNEPEKFPGLAHFLEHMLFMGTEAYPEENAFGNFLNLYNGHSNAYTASEMTVYYCSIDSSELSEMLSMFSSFFMSPLFMKGSVDREICAVDSEFLNTLNNDAWRIGALLSELIKDGELRGRFNCGNEETLRQENILDEVIKLWKDTYSSDLMKLVICSNNSLDELEELAQLFSRIENHNKTDNKINTFGKFLTQNESDKTDDFSKEELEKCCIFKEEFYSKIIQMAPISDTKKLTVFLSAPPSLHHFKTNPYSYIEHLFTKNESDGLLAQLKNAGLAFGLEFDFEHYIHSTRVRFNVELTDEGCKNYKMVLDMIVMYLSCMEANEEDFMRIKRIEGEEFMMKENDGPMELAETLSADIQMFPIENALNHDYVYEVFDSELINKIIRLLSDFNRWIIILLDKQGDFKHKEKYYGVEYNFIGEYNFNGGCHEILKETCMISPLVTSNNKDCMKVSDYLNSIECISLGKQPVKSEEFKHGKLTYIFDEQFMAPKTELFILLKNEKIKDLFVNLQLFLAIAEDAFQEAYARELYNYHVSLSTSISHRGILIKFDGVSEKIVEMCKHFFEDLQSVDLRRFMLFKKQRKDAYSKKMTNSPYRRLVEIFNQHLSGFKNVEEYDSILDGLSEADAKFIDDYRTEIVVVGNIKYSDIKDLYEFIDRCDIGKKFDIQGSGKDNDLSYVDNISFRTFDKFNNGIALFYKTCSFTDYNKDDSSSIPIFDSDCDEGSACSDDIKASIASNNSIITLRNFIVGRMIHQISKDIFFNQLRTTEQLGYCVATHMVTVNKQEYLGYMVQSEKPVEFLETRILKFVAELRELINAMETDDFETHKESLISFYEEPILNLEDLGNFVFNQHCNSAIDLDFNKKMISLIKTLEKKDLMESNILNKCYKVFSYPAIE